MNSIFLLSLLFCMGTSLEVEIFTESLQNVIPYVKSRGVLGASNSTEPSEKIVDLSKSRSSFKIVQYNSKKIKNATGTCKKVWKDCKCFCRRFSKTLKLYSCDQVFKLKWTAKRCWKCVDECDNSRRVSAGLGS